MNTHTVKAALRPTRQRGVTLIELLVGMLVGMMAVLVISQTLLTSEGQKRTATGGSDAQVNAALALYSIQRDVQMAGYGLTSSPAVVGCPISARYNSAVPTQFPTRLVPVMITRQADRPAGSIGDSIRMLASSKPGYSVPTRVIPPGYNPAGGTEFPVRASLGFDGPRPVPGDIGGDLALAASNATNPCWVFQVTASPPATGRTLPRGNDPTRWNPANTPDVAYGDGAVLINLGTLVDNIYEIDNTNNRKVLRISSFNAASPATRLDRDVQSDIVELRAFYGRDTSVPPDGVVDVYDVPTTAVQAAYTNADWLRILAVRVIVVARSSTWEKDPVTTANPEWSVGTLPALGGAAPCVSGSGECITLDVGAGVAGDVEAKHHRYKIFDTVIPLRNMLWSSS